MSLSDALKTLDAHEQAMSAEEKARVETRAAFTKRAIESHTAARKLRCEKLSNEKLAIEQVVSRYEGIDNKSNDLVRFSRRLVALKERRADEVWSEVVPGTKPDLRAELASRPPLTRLVNRDNNSISFLMTMLYVANQTTLPGHKFRNGRPNHVRTDDDIECWAALAGFRTPGSSRAVRARLVRSLQALNRLDIVRPHRGADGSNRWEGFELLSPDGSGGSLVIPGAGRGPMDAVAVPPGFFRQGWHLVLTPAEVTMFLAIADQTAIQPRSKNGVGFAIRTRRGYYGISDEVYQSIHTLEEFGLIRIVDTMEGRNRGKLKAFSAGDPEATRAPEPYRIIYPPTSADLYSRSAIETVLEQLKAHPVPERLKQVVDFSAITI